MLRPAGRSIWFQRVRRASNTPAGNPAVLCLFIRLPSGPRVAKHADAFFVYIFSSGASSSLSPALGDVGRCSQSH